MNCSQRFRVCLKVGQRRWRPFSGGRLLVGLQGDRYSLAQQVFEACVQFYVVLVQVPEELVRAQNLCDSDQLEDQSKYGLLLVDVS